MASPIQWTDVSGAFPEIAIYTPPRLPVPAQTIILSIVNGTGINVDNFGGEDATMTHDVRILYAAHLATMFVRQGAPIVSSQSEGGASQSYWYGWMNPQTLHMTSYGILLAGIISGTAARAGGVFG